MWLSILRTYLGAFFERTLNEWLMYNLNTFWVNLSKKPQGFFWKCSQCAVRTCSDTTPVNSDPVLTWYVSPSFSFTLVLVPHFICSPVVPPSDYAPLVGTPVLFRMFSRVSVVLQNSGLLLVVVYLGPALDSFGVLAAYAVFITWSPLMRYHLSVTDLPSMPWVSPLA